MSFISNEVIEENGNLLKYCSASLRKSDEFVLLALKNCPQAINFAHKNLKNDKKFLYEAMTLNNQVFDLYRIQSKMMKNLFQKL